MVVIHMFQESPEIGHGKIIVWHHDLFYINPLKACLEFKEPWRSTVNHSVLCGCNWFAFIYVTLGYPKVYLFLLNHAHKRSQFDGASH